MFFRVVSRVLLPALAFVVLTACDEDQTERPDRLLERPKTAVFFCAMEDSEGTLNYASAHDCLIDEDNAEHFALVLSSSRGELALVDLDEKTVVDLDDAITGYNHLPLGFGVESLAMDEASGTVFAIGREPATLYRIDVNNILGRVRGVGQAEPVFQSPVMTASGILPVNPTELAYHEGTDSVYAVFPRCGMVARISRDGTLLDSWTVSDGTELMLNTGLDPLCPEEVPGLEGSAPTSDVDPPVRWPAMLALNGDDLYIGFQSSSLDDDTLLRLTLDGTPVFTSVPVESGTGGWRRLRISPDTRWGRFLYGVTMHGAVRVVRLDDQTECDTNADGRTLPILDVTDDLRGCVPNGSYDRMFRAKGPGMEVTDHRKVVDVAFFTLLAPESDHDPYEKSSFLGTFAILLTMDGLVFLVNVDEEFEEGIYDYRYGTGPVYPEEVLAHHFRNGTDISGSYTFEGRPRMGDVVSYLRDGGLHYYAEGEPDITLTDATTLFDIEGYMARTETWSFTWEGSIPESASTSGQFSENDDRTGFFLDDVGASFCSVGARPGDVVRVTGCYDDADCQEGYECGRTPIQTFESNGLCFPEGSVSEYVSACARFLATDREFLVTDVANERLSLAYLPLFATLDATGAGVSCTEDAECYALGVEQGGLCGDDGICVAAPSPRSDGGEWCLAGLTTYELRVDNSFLMDGEVNDYQTPLVADATGMCVDTGRFDYRIPLGQGRVQTPYFDFEMTYTEGTPIPFRYELRFELYGGFSKYYGDVGARLPSFLGLATDGSVYITDMGDTGSSTTIVGQFLRLVPEYFSLDAEFIVR